MNTDTINKVVAKVLTKLDCYVDTVVPEKLNPQSLKHVTATLKDIKDLQQTEQTEATIHVAFSNPEWSR